MKKITIILLLTLGFAVRLYRIEAPLADWHSWRQADTSAVARNFVQNGYDLLHPRFENISNVASGKFNPHGWRFVEFPLYNSAHALLFQSIGRFIPGQFPFETAGRLTSIFFWLVAGWWLYQIAKKTLGRTTATVSLFFFLFLPYGIYYSRAILPGPAMVSLSLGSIWFLFPRSGKGWGKGRLAISLILAAGAILTKPYAVFLIFPSAIVLINQKVNKKNLLTTLFYFFLASTPFILWRLWMRQFPAGIPASDWLFNKNGIRLRPAWWRWIFGERIARLILGYWGVGLILPGLLSPPSKKNLLFFSWLGGLFAYLVIFAGGNVQHDYYQIILLPAISVFMAMGMVNLARSTAGRFHRLVNLIILFAVIGLSLFLSWYQIRGYYQINRPAIVAAGKAADRVLPPEAKVIAPYGGDSAFLYQINRQGWAVVNDSIANMVKKGANYYVSVDFDDQTNKIMADKKNKVIEKNADFVIIKLGQ